MKKKLELHARQLRESTERIPNPGRGWYTLYSFSLEQNVDLSELKWCLREQESVALVMVDCHAYRSGKIDETALQNLTDILQFFFDAGKDVILRPVYDTEGHGREREPESLDIICTHVRQIGDVLQKSRHSVFLIQGLMIGSWGEMHNSSYLHPEALQKLYECIRPCLGKERYLAVRTPQLWRTLVTEAEYETAEYDFISLFDDALFASSSDLGTFGTCMREAGWEQSWIREQELTFMQRVCKYLPVSGEVVAGDWQIDTGRMLGEMRKMHLGFLNSAHDGKVLEQWKQKTCTGIAHWEACCLYDYIGEHLGYRYVIQSVELAVGKGFRKKYSLRFTVQNTGLGVCIWEAVLCLTLQYEYHKVERKLQADLRTWLPGETQMFEIPVDREPCDISLSMYRKTDHHILRFANENADSLFLGCLR